MTFHVMEADIHMLYESDFYRVTDFRCRCQDCRTSKPEYSEAFCVSFVRKGNFLFNVFRHSLDSYTGCVLVTRPGYERTVTHIHEVPDECTIFEFKNDFYHEVLEHYPSIKFLHNNDLHSTLVKINPETEYLHYRAMNLINSGTATRLEMDSLVMNLIETVFSKISDYKPDFHASARLKKNHLSTVEKAKHYITQNYPNDISLVEIAEHCCMSPFHFSRVFKAITSYSPHQFLLQVRLKSSEVLLRDTSLPVTDVAFASGFNSIEHFSAAFRNRFTFAPIKYRDHYQSST